MTNEYGFEIPLVSEEECKLQECIEELEKENEKLRNNGFTVSAMTEQQLKVAIEKGEQLEQENTELDMKRKAERKIFQGIVEKKNEQLAKATKLLNEFMRISKASDEDFEHDYSELIGETEQFIKEVEK